MRIELGDLMGAIPLPPGAWFWLLDTDTGFSDKVSHPWVLPYGYEPAGRTAFAHVLPRSTSEPWRGSEGVDFLTHEKHGVCDGKQCSLNQRGWIKPLRSQARTSWINNGSYICTEPSTDVLNDIQSFDGSLGR